MKKIFVLFIIYHAIISGQEIQLNEIVSSNGDILYDEDGETPDWIEIHNNTSEPKNLFGYGITDDPDDLQKWVFPSVIINPSDYLVLFASEKDRNDVVAQWDAIIDWGDIWSYWIGNSEPVSDWELPETDLSFWPTGSSGFGYGDYDDNTEIEQTTSVYVRKSFTIEDPTIISKALFHIDYDDGYIAYLNGIEFSRRNLGAIGTPVSYNTTTTALHEAEIYAGGSPEVITINLEELPLVQGTNILAIQVHNYTSNSSDLSCIPFLTVGYNTEIDNIQNPNELLNLPNSYLHTNFRISSDGELLVLSDENEIILDSIYTGELETNMSFGRELEGPIWALFSEPTPGESNSSAVYIGALSSPIFSLESGFYSDNQIAVEITSSEDFSTIYYTTDGSKPTENDYEYENPITINSNTVIRARSIFDGWVPSKITTKTFILEEDSFVDLPKIFLTADSSSLFDSDTGMYVMGPNAEWDFPYFGANFWEDWERPIHFQILEEDGTHYSADAGAKIFGGWSRAFPQKSISIFARGYIGTSNFEYPLFPDSDVTNYEAFVLRNSGNDWESSMLRDGFITSIANNLDIDHQQYRPAILYVNGDFWGIQNIREKVNEHFISAHHYIPPEHIDLLDIEGIYDRNIVHGTNADYQILINYLDSQDMNDPIVSSAIENWIDLESYMSYQAFQIFVDNRDWPGNNIKFWRDHRVGGKWRWILYDTDFGFGIWDPSAYTFNTLDFALDPYGPGWPNPPWSTFVFRKLMDNNKFKNLFINVYCDMLNTVFQPEFLLDHLDSIKGQIENIIPVHRDRWYNDGNWPNSTINWDWRIEVMENFANNRRTHVINHIRNEFNLPNIAQIEINIIPQNSGSVKLNTLDIDESSWTGYYFPSIPISATAIHNDGYQFSHWLEFPDSNNTLNVNVTDPLTLTAIFLPTQLLPGSVVVNEINYHSNDDFDSGDWIELYNPGQLYLDMSGWIFKDNNDDNVYTFPEETILDSNQYMIVSNDLELFASQYPNVVSVIGPFDFGLSGGGDAVRIFDENNTPIDSINYDDDDPWPIEADGDGATLELINPLLDNSLAASWTSSNNYGSPGEQNTNFLSSNGSETTLPRTNSLLSSYPNPFNGIVNIPFVLSYKMGSSIIIYDILGKIIREVSLQRFDLGKHSIVWDGKNHLGQEVSTGIYFVRLKNSTHTNTQKLIYLK